MSIFLNKILPVLLVMIPTLTFGIFSKPTEMMISLIAGFTSAVLLNIDKFESFKAGQLEAKLQKAEEVIDDANATIEQLNSVAIPLLKTNLASLLYEGTFDGMPPHEQEKNFYELLQIKKTLNLIELDGNFSEAAKGITSHYFSNIFREVAEVHDGFRLKYEKFTMKDYAPETPSTKELKTFFDDNPNFLSEEVKRNLEKFISIKQDFINE